MRKYLGISFPFQDSTKGDYVRMTETDREEVRSNLIHLLITRKGSRYYLPEFGTRLYDYIFEQMDNQTFTSIESEVRDACKKFIPNLDIISITVTPAESIDDSINTDPELDQRIFRTGTDETIPYTAQIRIDYNVNSGTYATRDFVILNL